MKKAIYFFILTIISQHAITTGNYLPFGHDILLIINYNHAHFESVSFLKKLYEPWFPNIVFYGPGIYPEVNEFYHDRGYFAYAGISHAMEKYPGYRGYLQLHDDCILNCWNINKFDKSKLWVCYEPEYFNSVRQGCGKINLEINGMTWWPWWHGHMGYSAINNAYHQLPIKFRSILEANCSSNAILVSYSDMVYIPREYKDNLTELTNIFHRSHVFLEIAIPTICGCLDSMNNWEYLKPKLGQTEHDYEPTVDAYHPLKLSNKNNREFIEKIFAEDKHFANIQ